MMVRDGTVVLVKHVISDRVDKSADRSSFGCRPCWEGSESSNALSSWFVGAVCCNMIPKQ